MLLCLWQLGHAFDLAVAWWLTLFAVAVHFAWQQWLVGDQHRETAFIAFKNNVWIGVLLWLGVVSSFLW
jgi:4-hydroxybenzoate polyprenyltransferase